MNRSSAMLVDRLRERAAMCREFSQEAQGTRLAYELSSLAEEMARDASRLAEVESRPEPRA